MNQAFKRCYVFGDFRLDGAERRLLRAGTPISLPPKILDTLLLLVENAGHLVEKDEFMKQLWPGTFVGEDALARNISILRKTLGESSDSQSFIATVPTRGYRFVAIVEELQATPRADEMDVGRARTPTPAPQLILPGIRSLAVLPFENLSGDPAQEYFAEGITDEIITRVAQIRELRVISRTSSMQYKGTRKSAMQIGRELGVEGLLEGTLERSGERVRLRAQLIHAPTDCHCWAQTYDWQMTDILALESQLAEDVAGQVRAHVGSEQSVETLPRAVSPDAFEHYLRGKHFLHRRDGGSLERAVEHLRQTTEIEPGYAPAYAALAMSYFYLAYLSGRYRGYMLLARSAAQCALRLDSTLSQAHTALAITATLEYNLDEAEREHQLAVSLCPNDAEAHGYYASSYLLEVGRLEDANHEMAQARALDPASCVIATNWAGMLVCEGRLDEALSELNRVIEMAPGYSEPYPWRVLIFLLQKKHREALADLDHLKQSAKTLRTRAMAGYALGAIGQREQALAVLSELSHQPAHVSAWWLAIVHLGIGNKEQAIDFLERAYEEHCSELIGLNSMPIYDPLRGDPRFCKLVSRVGLPDAGPKSTFRQEGSTLAAQEAAAFASKPAATLTKQVWNRWRRRMAFAALILGAGIFAGMVTFYLLSSPTEPRLLRTVRLTDSGAIHGNQKLLTDGPRLYFLERTQGRWVPKWMPTSGGAAVPIELPFFADLQDISPDGSELLIRELREYENGIWTVSTAGREPHRLGISDVDAAAYTRDGHAVLYSQGPTVFACDHDGSSKRQVVTLPGQVLGITVSPQGDRLRFYVGQGQEEGVVLWESKNDGSSLHRVIKDWPRPHQEMGGSWSPDGRWFTFSAPRGGGVGRDVWLLGEPSLLRHKASTAIPLTSGPMDFIRPTFSHDGKRIFAVAETRHGELLRYDFKKSEFTQFLGGISVENVEFSPDKDSLVYISFPDGRIWRAHADGSAPLPLTTPPMRAGRAYWSPDGSKIAFEGTPKRGARWNVYVIPPMGGIPEQVATSTDHGGLAWRSDSKSLVIGIAGHNSALQIVDLEQHSITALPGTDGADQPSLSPSGRYLIAFGKDAELVMFDLTTQREKVIATANEDISSPQWSADERYVYFNRFVGTAPGFYRVRVADGFTSRLMELTRFTATGSWGAWSTIAPDGSLLLLRDLGGTDLYAIEWSER